MKKCLGCGISLQVDNPDAPGYVKSLDQDYCRRCFRLAHYGDLTLDLRDAIDPDALIKEIKKHTDAAIVLIMDILHISSDVHYKLFQAFKDRPLFIIINKIDLLPDNSNFAKIETYILDELKKMAKGNDIRSLILTSIKDHHLNDLFYEEIAASPFRKFIFVGLANAGKSSIINKLTGSKKLTTSFYPGTTLDFNAFHFENYTFYDAPGICDGGSILMNLDSRLIEEIYPLKTIKPLVYQLYNKQSFFINDLMRLDAYVKDRATIIFYFDPRVQIHRTKLANADDYELKYPLHKDIEYDLKSYKNLDKEDLAINGMGFIGFHHLDLVKLTLPNKVEVKRRKGLL